MVLRKVEPGDYEAIKTLCEDKETLYQWLWHQSELETSKNQKVFIEDEISFSYTDSDFAKDLSSDDRFDKVYVMEKERQLIGYVRIICYKRGVYRISEWGMFDPSDENSKLETFCKLKKRYKHLHVPTTNPSAVRLFKNLKKEVDM